jgi:hypothetical protein
MLSPLYHLNVVNRCFFNGKKEVFMRKIFIFFDAFLVLNLNFEMSAMIYQKDRVHRMLILSESEFPELKNFQN